MAALFSHGEGERELSEYGWVNMGPGWTRRVGIVSIVPLFRGTKGIDTNLDTHKERSIDVGVPFTLCSL